MKLIAFVCIDTRMLLQINNSWSRKQASKSTYKFKNFLKNDRGIFLLLKYKQINTQIYFPLICEY